LPSVDDRLTATSMRPGMSAKTTTKNHRYYNIVVWTIVGVLAIGLLPWTNDWNSDGLRLAILIILLVLLSPTLLNWIAIVLFRLDPYGRNRSVFELNNMLLSLAVTIDKLLCLIPNNPYAGGYYQHSHTLALNYLQYAERDQAEKVLRNLQSEMATKLGEDNFLLFDIYALSISLYREADKHAECEQSISRFMTLSEKHADDAAPASLAGPLGEAACYLAKMGKLEESEKTIAKTISLFESIDDQALKNSCRPAYLTNIGLAYCYNEKLDEAAELLREHQQLLASLNDVSIDKVYANCNLSWVLNELNQHEESVALGEETIRLFEKIKFEDEQTQAIVFANYAEALAGLSRASEAKEMMEQYFPLLLDLRKNCLPETAATYRSKAKIFASLGESSLATENYDKAISILTDQVEPNHPRVKRWIDELSEFKN